MTLEPERREQVDDGRSRRDAVPRASHGQWAPAADRADPIEVLMASNEGRVEELVPIRFGRMAVSPFTFLRGSAAVMAADLAAVPTTGLRVQACGDCHLMNFGLFATPERNVVFGLNDFDETLPGPWEWDVKRLVASFVVAARDVGLRDSQGVDVAAAAVRSYRERMWQYAEMSPLEIWYDRLDLARGIEEAPDETARRERERLQRQARKRVAENLFPKLVTTEGGRQRIADQPPLIYHPPDLTREDALSFIDTYRASLAADRRLLFDRYRFEDAAIKVVGVGSVGTRCLVALFSSDGGHPLLLQVKEANASVLERYVGDGSKSEHNGARVVVGQHLMQPASDIFLGWGTGRAGRDFYVRQLRDMKVSITLRRDVTPLTRYAEFCGLALARAHANTGSAAAIAGYLGTGSKADSSFAQFGLAYANQTELDHQALVEAIDAGRVEAIMETL
ncbi:MAG: DUF2252 domain-containing protein [Acidimicrobiia bacterium]